MRVCDRVSKVHLLVDVSSSREVLWITTYIDRVLWLVNPDPVYLHGRRKGERRKVGGLKLWRYS